MAVETWAHCGTCGRWFYVPRERGGGKGAGRKDRSDNAELVCPVCGSAPDAVEERPGS